MKSHRDGGSFARTSRGLGTRGSLALSAIFMALCVAAVGYSGILRGLDVFFDFYIFYAAGIGWNQGIDLYDAAAFKSLFFQVAEHKNYPEAWVDNVYVYPPQGSALFGVLAALPLQTAHRLLLAVNVLLLAACLGIMALILSRYRPLGPLEMVFLSSLLLTDFARTNLAHAQWGIVLCALLLATFVLAERRHDGLAGLCLAATGFKPTLLPFLGLGFLLRRQYRLVALCALFVVLLTVVPLLATDRPVGDTVAGFVRAVLRQDDPHGANSPSPDAPFFYHASMIHLAPLVYRLFGGISPIATGTLWLAIATLCGTTAWLLLRGKPTHRVELLDFGLVSALSMVCVYHRHYDIFLLFPGLLYIYGFTATLRDAAAKRRWAIFLTAVLLSMTVLNYGMWKLSSLLPGLRDHYLWLVLLPLPWSGLAVLCALLWLKTRAPALPERATAPLAESEWRSRRARRHSSAWTSMAPSRAG